MLGRVAIEGAALTSPLCKLDVEFCEGRVLGGVVEPGAVFIVEDDLFDGGLLRDESLERLLAGLSVRKLFFESRLRSWRKEGIPTQGRTCHFQKPRVL